MLQKCRRGQHCPFLHTVHAYKYCHSIVFVFLLLSQFHRARLCVRSRHLLPQLQHQCLPLDPMEYRQQHNRKGTKIISSVKQLSIGKNLKHEINEVINTKIYLSITSSYMYFMTVSLFLFLHVVMLSNLHIPVSYFLEYARILKVPEYRSLNLEPEI